MELLIKRWIQFNSVKHKHGYFNQLLSSLIDKYQYKNFFTFDSVSIWNVDFKVKIQ